MHIFVYNGRSSADFGLAISGEDTWKKPAPDIELVQVPGRNGDLLVNNNRFLNADIVYHVGVRQGFDTKFQAFINFLMNSPGYHRLEDSYHPDYYRMAAAGSAVEPSMFAYNHGGTFDLVFTCKPQMFLKAGEKVRAFTAAGTILNPTLFDARPLIRVYGSGALGVGSETLTITDNTNNYIDIDCDMQDAYRGSANMNAKVTLSSGEFPVLHPGSTGITLGSGITKVEITPRWWCL